MTVLSIFRAQWKYSSVTNIFWVTSVWLEGTSVWLLSGEGGGYKDESYKVPTLRSHNLVGGTEWGKMSWGLQRGNI